MTAFLAGQITTRHSVEMESKRCKGARNIQNSNFFYGSNRPAVANLLNDSPSGRAKADVVQAAAIGGFAARSCFASLLRWMERIAGCSSDSMGRHESSWPSKLHA